MSGSTDALKLAPADLTDLGDVVELANLAYRGTGGWNSETGLIDGKRITLTDLLAQTRAQPEAQLLVHREGEELLACVRVEPEGEAVWHLGLLAVRPDVQARQLGRRVLAAAEAFVRDQGGSLIRMAVIDARDTLVAWYERRGYRPTGESERFPYGDMRLGQPLRSDLRFVLLEKALD